MMRKRMLFHTGLLILAFVLGRYVLPSPTSGVTGLSTEAIEELERGDFSKSSSRSTRTIRHRTDPERVAPEEVATALGQDMLVGDYFQRHLQVMTRLNEIDASNWQEVYDEFRNTTRDANIELDELWPKMLVKIGQVAGEEALNHWIAEDPGRYETHLLHVMWGWAMTDPQGAAHYYSSDVTLDPGTKNKLLSRVAGGIALTNPGELVSFVATLSEEEQNQTIGHSVWNLIHGGGIERANYWLDELQRGDFSEQMKARSFQEVARAVTKRIGGVGGDLGLEWFTQYGSSPYMTPDLVGQAASSYRNEESLTGLDFLKTATDFPALSESRINPPGLPLVIRNALASDPDGLERWLEQNRGAAFYSAAVQHYGAALERAGLVEKADKWRGQADQ